MDYNIIETAYGTIKTASEEHAAFWKENGEKTLKELFNLEADDTWLDKVLFNDLNLSVRAHNTILQSFAERDWNKQTLNYLTDYTLALVFTRRNAGWNVLKEILKEVYRVTNEQDAITGKQREMFDPGILDTL